MSVREYIRSTYSNKSESALVLRLTDFNLLLLLQHTMGWTISIYTYTKHTVHIMPYNPQILNLIKETAECAISHKNTKFSEILNYKHMINI
jgi:hypothetical protein